VEGTTGEASDVDHRRRQRSLDAEDDDSASFMGMVESTGSNQFSDSLISRTESGIVVDASEVMDRSDYFDPMDESITERGDDEFLRPSHRREKRVVFVLGDDDLDASDMDRSRRSTQGNLLTGINFELMKSKLHEEGEGDSDESSSYHSVDVRVTLDYKEDDNSVEFDDPSVIDEADLERDIRKAFASAALWAIAAKLWSKLIECLCKSSSSNIEQDIAANAVEDVTNASTTNVSASSANLGVCPGVTPGGQVQ
jgi:hypothetical protein